MPLALALGYFVVFAGILTMLLGVALTGRATDGVPATGLEIPERPAPSVVMAVPAAPSHAAAAAPIPSPAASLPLALQPPAPAAGPAPVIATPVFAGRNLVADPALLEQTAQGPLPRIAQDGRSPMTAYAPSVPAGKVPQIAIVIGGLGLSARATASALASLPPGVTLAFLPYETDLQHWVGEARNLGHEVLLEVPMEPVDYPDSDPGPHTLLAAVGAQTNSQRLDWLLSRVTGYAGVTNLLGDRLLADPISLEPVMAELARRGLFFFDSGGPARSAAPDIARRIGAPYVQSATTLDTVLAAGDIDARLTALEQLARTNGSASAIGFVTPVTVERVTLWAKGLPARGLALVPASAIVRPPR